MPDTRSREKEPTSSVEDLINRVCTSFVNKLELKFEARLQKLDDQLRDIGNTLKAASAASSIAINSLEAKLDNLDQYTRRNSLRFTGIVETEDENMVDTVIDFINSKLHVDCNTRDIDTAFRIRGNNGPNSPRPILVRFVTNNKCGQIYRAKKLLKSTPFSIFEDLTKSRYMLLQSAKKKYGPSNVWSMNGKIFYWNTEDKSKHPVKKEDL